MKNDLLNAMLHISLNGRPHVNSPESANLFEWVTNINAEQNHGKVPKIYVERKVRKSVSTQTIEVEYEFENTDLITEMNIKVCSETMEPFSKMLLHFTGRL